MNSKSGVVVVRHVYVMPYLLHPLEVGLDLLLHLVFQLPKQVCCRCRSQHVVLEDHPTQSLGGEGGTGGRSTCSSLLRTYVARATSDRATPFKLGKAEPGRGEMAIVRLPLPLRFLVEAAARRAMQSRAFT